jgi:hypothetical protein
MLCWWCCINSWNRGMHSHLACTPATALTATASGTARRALPTPTASVHVLHTLAYCICHCSGGAAGAATAAVLASSHSSRRRGAHCANKCTLVPRRAIKRCKFLPPPLHPSPQLTILTHHMVALPRMLTPNDSQPDKPATRFPMFCTLHVPLQWRNCRSRPSLLLPQHCPTCLAG